LLKISTFTALTALCLSLFATSTAAAQSSRAGSAAAAAAMRASDQALDRTRLEQRERQDSIRAKYKSPQETVAAAQAALTAAGKTCIVTEAALISLSETGDSFEAVCQTGPGYALIASTPPQTFDCVILAGQADLLRSRDPNAEVGTLCNLPANQNADAVIKAYATEARVPCTVERAGFVGHSPEGAPIYEASCPQSDGYWFSQSAGAWKTVECLEVMKDGGVCRMTTPEVQAAALQAKLVGTPAAGCNVQQAAFLGQNANGRFYEAKCGAGGGLVVRVKDGAAEQTYGCADARHIGGGCTLTAVPPEDLE